MIGAGVTGTALLPGVGVSMTLSILSAGTFVVAALAWLTSRQYVKSTVALFAAIVSLVPGDPIEAEPYLAEGITLLEAAEGTYGELAVFEYRGARFLSCNGVVQTAEPTIGFGVGKGTLIAGGDYVELVPYFCPQAETALLVGVGGALHEKCLALYGIKLTGFEIEPETVRLARDYFGLDAPVTIGDGRALLRRCHGTFDAVILDVFLGGNSPEHLFTREAFQDAKQVLNPGGVLAIHLITRPNHAVTTAIARTLGDVFPSLLAVRTKPADDLQHVYLFAGENLPEPGPDLYLPEAFSLDAFFEPGGGKGPALTDDRTNLAMMSRDLVMEHRRRSLDQWSIYR